MTRHRHACPQCDEVRTAYEVTHGICDRCGYDAVADEHGEQLTLHAWEWRESTDVEHPMVPGFGHLVHEPPTHDDLVRLDEAALRILREATDNTDDR